MTGKEVLTLTGHMGGLLGVAFSPDGQQIVTGSNDGTAKVWDAANGKPLLTLAGHIEQVWSAVFSPDGRRILTGSPDGTAKLWDATNGKELLTLRGHAGDVRASFSPDGRRIATASWDHNAKVWEAASPAQVESWRQEEQVGAQQAAAEQRVMDADEKKRAEAAARDRAARAQDPGVIKQWLVLLPIPYQGRDGARALQEEQVEHESQLRPRAGDSVKAGSSELVWREVPLEDYMIDFNKLAVVGTEWSVAYAVAYIHSETSQRQVRLLVGSDDQAKIYLNGKPIYQNLDARTFIPDRDVVEAGIELQAGLNVLVFKVVNEVYDWLGSVRFTAAAGQPLKGLSVSLDPGR
jgi:hypothetical protein